MVDLSRRATDTELLDEGVPDDEVVASLADLRFVNDWLGNRARVLAAARPHLQDLLLHDRHLHDRHLHRSDATPAFKLLDVGCGSGDLLHWLGVRMSPTVMTVGVDIKRLHLIQAPSEVRCVAADARTLPFASGAFDVVTTSLFLHHFDGLEVATVLRELFRVTRRALIVTDLRRAFVPYAFGRLAFPLLFRSQVSVVDGLTSIRRAFTARELAAAFGDAGIAARVERTWPYGLLAVAEKAP